MAGRLKPRVLLIEDDLDLVEALREMLSLVGYDVETAMTGAAGVECARCFVPDVVVCDIALPVLDGLAVARALRADPAVKDARLIALTAYDELDARTREAGFDRYIVKPAVSVLLDAVETLADRGELPRRRRLSAVTPPY
jgi:CheY-like chemotaxis protein